MANENPTHNFNLEKVSLSNVESIKGNLFELDKLSHAMQNKGLRNMTNTYITREKLYLMSLIGAYKFRLEDPSMLQAFLTQTIGDLKDDKNKTPEEEVILDKLRAMQTGGGRRRRKSKTRKHKKSKKTRKH
jgi:hypothetical protein